MTYGTTRQGIDRRSQFCSSCTADWGSNRRLLRSSMLRIFVSGGSATVSPVRTRVLPEQTCKYWSGRQDSNLRPLHPMQRRYEACEPGSIFGYKSDRVIILDFSSFGQYIYPPVTRCFLIVGEVNRNARWPEGDDCRIVHGRNNLGNRPSTRLIFVVVNTQCANARIPTFGSRKHERSPTTQPHPAG